MKLGLLGGAGQVGSEVRLLGPCFDCLVDAPARTELDVTDHEAVETWISRNRFDVVINCAAYTAVDAAEDHPEAAASTNVVGAKYVAEACSRFDVPTLYVSTDYVFDGSKSTPYVETDAPNPTGVYGRTKLDGEVASRVANPLTVVLRVSWVFSTHGNNFVKTMLKLATDHREVRVVDDQIGSPCSARSIADALLRIAAHIVAKGDGFGTYHFASKPYVSWARFAEEIFAIQEARGALSHPITVRPISTQQYPTKAKRPANSRLDATLLREALGIDLADWREELSMVLRSP